MSLLGFKAQNHPQQTLPAGPLDDVDDRATHPLHFEQFSERLGPFTLDVAAAAHNTKCHRYFDRTTDGLRQSWGPRWINTYGVDCRCSCHSSDVPIAESGVTDARSFPALRSETADTVSAENATDDVLESGKLQDELTLNFAQNLSQKKSGIESRRRDVSGSGMPAGWITTGGVSGANHFPTSGPPKHGSAPATSGGVAALTAAQTEPLSKITTFPSPPPIVPAQFLGTSSQLVSPAIDGRERVSPLSGSQPNDDWSSSSSCMRCIACSLRPETVFCNPPYSSIEPWVRKAWLEADRALGIVMLLPANRCEQKWWQQQVEPHRDRAGSGLRVEFLPGRMRFIKAGQLDVGPNERPPFGCCLLIWTHA